MIKRSFEFFSKIPFFSKFVWSSILYLTMSLLFSNLTWASIRTKLPFLNRMFYSENLCMICQYKRYTEARAGNDSLEETGVLPVITLPISEELLTPTMLFSAVLEPKERVEVYSKVSGRVEHFFVKEGDRVAKGQKLAKLDSLTFEFELAKQKASLDSAKALHQLSKDKYEIARRNVELKLGEADKRIGLYHKATAEQERYEDIVRKKESLWEEKVISEEELKNLKLELAAKELNVANTKRDLEMILVGIRDDDIKQAGFSVPLDRKEKIELLKTINTKLEKAELDVAETNLRVSQVNLKSSEMYIKESTLHSPIDGIVAKINRPEGELVNAGGGGVLPVMTLISKEGVYVSFSVNEGDLGLIKQGLNANVTIDSLPNRQYKGVIKKISPLVDQKTHTAEVKLELLDRTSELRPGMFVRAEVQIGESQKAILIPISSLIAVENSDASVYILKGRKAIKNKLKLGDKKEDRVMVELGLVSGDVLITSPINRLYDGVNVLPKFQ